MSRSNNNNRYQNPSEPLSETQLLNAVEKMVRVQEKNLEVKTKELDVEQENIRSNERIALATIEAQKVDRNQQMSVFTKLHTQKNVIVGGIVVGVIAIIITAMLTDNTAFAIEFLKIGGAVLAGYIAGVGKTKMENAKENSQSAD